MPSMMNLRRGIYAKRAAAPAPAATHKYWRLRFSATNASPAWYVTIAEVQLRASIGVDVPNMAALGAASSSSNYDGTGTYSADKAIDNNLGTCWISAQNQFLNGWWKFTFTTAQAVNELVLKALNTTGGAAQMPSTFLLEWSDDDITWTEVLSSDYQIAWGAAEARTFKVPTKAKPLYTGFFTASGNMVYPAEVAAGDLAVIQQVGTVLPTFASGFASFGTPDLIHSTSSAYYASKVLTSGDITSGLTFAIEANSAAAVYIFRGATAVAQVSRGPQADPALSTVIPAFTPSGSSKGTLILRGDRDPNLFSMAGITDYLAVSRRGSTFFSFGADLRSDYAGGSITCPLVQTGFFGGYASAFELT